MLQCFTHLRKFGIGIFTHLQQTFTHNTVCCCLQTTDVAKMVSESWKKLDPEERKVWDLKAEKDKERYELEKTQYKGPWKIPSNKRKQKDPTGKLGASLAVFKIGSPNAFV